MNTESSCCSSPNKLSKLSISDDQAGVSEIEGRIFLFLFIWIMNLFCWPNRPVLGKSNFRSIIQMSGGFQGRLTPVFFRFIEGYEGIHNSFFSCDWHFWFNPKHKDRFGFYCESCRRLMGCFQAIRPIPIVLVKCWKVAHWNAKKLLKNCQKSKKLLPKFQKLLPKFLAIFI